MIYFTELDHLPVYAVKGEYLGRLEDLCVAPAQNSLRVASYLVKSPKKALICITHDQMQSLSVRAGQTSVPRDEVRCYAPDEGLLKVKKDILDQQIIDVNNRKVVRVNDVDFDIRPTDHHAELRIVAVNVGMAAAIRRLLQGLLAKHTIRMLTSSIPTKTIPWEFVNLIESDPQRRVKLRLSYDRVAQLHPADIADILEELSRDEQKAVIEGLDDETAAQALSEIPTRMQADLLESIPAQKAADIVEEMPPDEAADVLHELSPETSAEVLSDMAKDEADDNSAPDVDDASGIQGRIRVFLPPEASTFTAKVQEPAKANVDESLQAAKCLACVGVAEVIYPTAHGLIHLLNKFHRRNCRPPLGEVLNPPLDIALRPLAGKDVDARLARSLGEPTLHELEPDEVKPFGQLRNPGLFAIDRQTHSRGDRGKCLKRLFSALRHTRIASSATAVQ